jgi:GDPmannose 4,6-dehydratase
VAYLFRSLVLNEKAYDIRNKCIIAVDPRYFRPTDVETLQGDPSKAKNKLGWSLRTTFDELVAMVREPQRAGENR